MKYLILFSMSLLVACRIGFFVPQEKIVREKSGLMLFYIDTSHREEGMTHDEIRMLISDSSLIGSLLFEGRLADSVILKNSIVNGATGLRAIEFGRFCDMESYIQFADTIGFDTNGIYLTLPVVINYVEREQLTIWKTVTRNINNRRVVIKMKSNSVHVVRLDPVTENIYRRDPNLIR